METGKITDIAHELANSHRGTIPEPANRFALFRDILATRLGILSTDQAAGLSAALLNAEDAFAEEMARAPVMTDSEAKILRIEHYEETLATWLKERGHV